MLEKFMSKALLYIDKDTQKLNGYFLPELGEGLIIAKDVKAGIELLKFKHSQKNCKTVLPEENKDGARFLLANNFQKETEAPRMILGDEVDWQPKLIFSRIGGFYG